MEPTSIKGASASREVPAWCGLQHRLDVVLDHSVREQLWLGGAGVRRAITCVTVSYLPPQSSGRDQQVTVR